MECIITSSLFNNKLKEERPLSPTPIKPIFIFEFDGKYSELLKVILGIKTVPKPRIDTFLIKLLLFTSISLFYKIFSFNRAILIDI